MQLYCTCNLSIRIDFYYNSSYNLNEKKIVLIRYQHTNLKNDNGYAPIIVLVDIQHKLSNYAVCDVKKYFFWKCHIFILFKCNPTSIFIFLEIYMYLDIRLVCMLHINSFEKHCSYVLMKLSRISININTWGIDIC